MSTRSGAIEYFRHPESRLPFSAAVRVGDIVYLSGQIGVGAGDKLADDIDAQAHQAMRNLAQSAVLAGTSLDRVFKCTIMLADMTLWPAFNAVYRSYFADDRLPARSAFGASGLALGALVEVEAMAWIDAK